MSKPSGRCAFCTGGNLSKEHFWPKWAGPLLPPGEAYAIQRGRGQEPMQLLRAGQGSIKNTKIRVVCQSCNNEWMSGLETAVRPILTPLMLRKPIIVDGPAQAILARWIALKVMVLEENDPEDVVFRQDDRDALREYGTVPANMRIRLAMCGVGGWESMSYRECIKASLTAAEPIGAKNCQVTTFTMGDLLVHTSISYMDGFDLDTFVPLKESIVRLWPKAHDAILWPAGPKLSLQDASTIVKRIDVLRSSPHIHVAPGA